MNHDDVNGIFDVEDIEDNPSAMGVLEHWEHWKRKYERESRDANPLNRDRTEPSDWGPTEGLQGDDDFDHINTEEGENMDLVDTVDDILDGVSNKRPRPDDNDYDQGNRRPEPDPPFSGAFDGSKPTDSSKPTSGCGCGGTKKPMRDYCKQYTPEEKRVYYEQKCRLRKAAKESGFCPCTKKGRSYRSYFRRTPTKRTYGKIKGYKGRGYYTSKWYSKNSCNLDQYGWGKGET